MTNLTDNRRFAGVSKLYGAQRAQTLREAHVCVVGLGGVGSWSAEALARSQIGKITLIDLDMVAESNTNRQLHALSHTYGMAKVEVMRQRILEINPDCKVNCIEDFVTPENCEQIFSADFDLVIDAIDQVRPKIAMIVTCRRKNIPLVVAGGAGGKTDPTQIKVCDLTQTHQDPLLAKIRSQLRRDHGFTRDSKKKFGIQAVFSSEPIKITPTSDTCNTSRPASGLNCAGYGSAVCVTAVFGMVAAAEAIRLLTK